MDVRAFDVEGYEGRPLPCALYEVGGKRAAVVLPGAAQASYRLGGSPARPDLHYVRALLLEQGYDVLEAWWQADERPEQKDSREAWYRENALAAIGVAGAERVRLLVGRSLGTAALTMLRASHASTASLWIAPLTTHREVRDALTAWSGPKLVVAGDADEAFELVPEIETILVPGGDHGLNVGDAPASARALGAALDGIRAWLIQLEAG